LASAVTEDALSLPALAPLDEWQIAYGATASTLSVAKGKPRLALANSRGSLAFTWPTNALPGYALQCATNLNPTILWHTLPDQPDVVGDQ